MDTGLHIEIFIYMENREHHFCLLIFCFPPVSLLYCLKAFPIFDNFLFLCNSQDDVNMAVVSPDFLVYRDRHCTDVQIIFSRNCIKIEGSVSYGDEGTFSFQWGIDDIIDIECQCCARVSFKTLPFGVNCFVYKLGMKDLLFFMRFAFRLKRLW